MHLEYTPIVERRNYRGETWLETSGNELLLVKKKDGSKNGVEFSKMDRIESWIKTIKFYQF